MSGSIFRYEFLNETKEPIDFDNFTKTVEGLRELYSIFFKKQNIKYDINSKLYIHELKSGSSIIDLCNQFAQNNHEMFEYINILLPQFCKYMADFSSFLRGDDNKKPVTEYSKQEYNSYQKFNSSIVADRGSKQNVKFINKGKIEIHIHQNYQQACTESFNAEKNKQALENELIEIPFENEKLELYQPSQEQDSKRFLGNAGIIKEISNEIVVMEVNDGCLNEIKSMETNPMNFIYSVDGISYTKNGKIKKYKITKLHTKIDKQDLLLI